MGILLTKEGKELTDYMKWGPEPLYKTVHAVKNIYKNRKLTDGGYASLVGLRGMDPTNFPGIETLTETIKGELVVGYREKDSQVAMETVKNIPTLIRCLYTEEEAREMLGDTDE